MPGLNGRTGHILLKTAEADTIAASLRETAAMRYSNSKQRKWAGKMWAAHRAALRDEAAELRSLAQFIEQHRHGTEI